MNETRVDHSPLESALRKIAHGALDRFIDSDFPIDANVISETESAMRGFVKAALVVRRLRLANMEAMRNQK